jgi:predicted AAA+ superfamily ATPase
MVISRKWLILSLMAEHGHITRRAKFALERALADTRVVAIQGARQTGKSTLAKELASERNARYLTLDAASARESARTNPSDFVRQAPEGMLVIDEIQRVPELLLEVKEAVDGSNRPGQFLITGSSDLSRLDEVQESLAGRMERVELMPFSQQELQGSASAFLPDAFSDDYRPSGGAATLSRSDYLELAVCGGYPEARSRSSKQRRDAWFDNYVRLLFEQESAGSKYNSSPEQKKRLLGYLASISGKEAVVENIGSDLGIKRYGVEQIVSTLTRLFLVELVPAWSTNLTSRATKHPKVFLKDSGLAARLLHASSATTKDLGSPIAGALFETFVFNELLRMAGASGVPATFYHYRDARKREVDVVIEDERGQALLIEAKASSTVTASDFKALNYLLEKHPDRIVRGVVVYTGKDVLPFGERLLALPAQLLWQ